MDQTGALTITVPLFVGSIALTWFLIARAPSIPRELSSRAAAASVRLRLVGSDLLRDIRNQLNVALRDYDKGDDPYLTRVDYQVPSVLLRKYRKIMQLEKFARAAPGDVQRRIRIAVWVAASLTVLFFGASVLASLEKFIGMLPCHIALIVGAVIVAVGLVLGGVFFLRPYARVNKAEIRGLGELRRRPGLRSMAEALDVGDDTPGEVEEW
ncbi:hypothetical protein [Microbacterium maritypicum]